MLPLSFPERLTCESGPAGSQCYKGNQRVANRPEGRLEDGSLGTQQAVSSHGAFKVLDISWLQKCQISEGASNTLLTPSRESWSRGSTRKKTGPAMIKFLACGRCFVHRPRLIPTISVSHSSHDPITHGLVHCKPSTSISYYYWCCHHSYYK